MRALRTIFSALLVACAALGGWKDTSAQVFINEVMAANQTTLQDDSGEYDDWLEIYYPSGSSPALYDLSGHFLTDNRNWLTKWMIPESQPGQSTTIVAGQHLLFWIDDDEEQGVRHAPFKLSADGEKLYLVAPDEVTVIDSLWFEDMAPDVSLGRVCDGCEDWTYFNVPTPDDDNEVLPEPEHLMYINEVMPVNTDYFDDEEDEFEAWVEFYNPTGFNVNLANHTLEVQETGEVFTFVDDNPADTFIADGSHYLLWCDGELGEGDDHANVTLPASGATLIWRRYDGVVVDTYTYPALMDGESWGRQTDGDDTSVLFDLPTPRTNNDLIFVVPEELYINEIMPDNETDTADVGGGHPDWFEIYNPNPYDVDIAGYYISDKHENPTKWMVPWNNDSTIIEAFDFKLFWADEDGLQGWNHCSFKLKDAGEELGLYSPDGFTRVDEIEWNDVTIPNDVSMGRETDGAETFVWFANPTPEYSNNGQPTSIAEEELRLEGLLYPNPARTVVHFPATKSGQVLDAQGRSVIQFREVTFLAVRDWPAGVYLVRWVDGTSQRLVVE